MNDKLFGTDGVRGVANAKLTPELAVALGLASGQWLAEQRAIKRALVGRDTRRSGSMLAAAFAAGLCSAGVDVVDLGIVPTGAVSYLVREGDFGLGAVISASHNPAPDNGIKLLAGDGRKLSEDGEAWIEARRLSPGSERPLGAGVGQISGGKDELERYMAMLLAIVPEGLGGLEVAVDGSHGAAYQLGVEMLTRLGARVSAIGVAPDGVNINAEGGATKPHVIQAFTQSSGCSIGLAFDGDADRVIFSDELGRLINGDRTMAIWCSGQTNLDPPVVVGTVMSNGGFEQYLAQQGIRLERTNVGDKYVSMAMLELGAHIGGEQSGHLIFADRGVTGDGLITALELLRVVRRSGKKVSELYDLYEAWPQVLVNLTVESKESLAASEVVRREYEDSLNQLEGHGRINLRPSGTQPMVRLMIEADREALRDEVKDRLVSTIAQEVGGTIYSEVDLTSTLGE